MDIGCSAREVILESGGRRTPGSRSGMGAWCSRPGSSSWKDAIIEKIGTPSWKACVRRVENERPSWMRSTANVMPLRRVAGPQEVAVHRVHGAAVGDRALGRDDRLGEHLPAVDAAERHRLRHAR